MEQRKLDMLEILRDLRKELASLEDVPPYLIFNDRTLEDLAANRPVFEDELKLISGIGEHKANKYGKQILQKIVDFKIQEKEKGSSFLYSKKLLDEGNSINEIALIRDLNVITVMDHLISYYEKDPDFELLKHLPEFDPKPIIDFIREYATIQGETPPNKEIHDHFRGKYEYYQIRIAYLMYLEQ